MLRYMIQIGCYISFTDSSRQAAYISAYLDH